ncbi:helix-turn-helix domain-containing protein [Nocardiopsis tropica]|uniref:Helix-turn-helix domain-containing protein n=1 Tax=Nocardiopsis tropica TaxID=109330 RepID=A0ABU7KLF1_9ACTN|nr:helix-turn-helix domain-containing protein [Nocardiopsis umidischolae]MEE2050123.1 helix-turn-helix domain-containing protein [Nocardiopsis umidischolae]
MDVLLEAAAQVFEREGLSATTNRIAERSGFSVGTLYQYFPNKQALLFALAERHVSDVRVRFYALFERLREEEPSWADTVRSMTTELVAAHRDRSRLHELMHDYAPRVPEGVAELKALRATAVIELASHLRRCGLGGRDPERTSALLFHTADTQLHGALLGAEDAAEVLTRSLLALSEA